MKLCPGCRAEVPDRWIFCGLCGEGRDTPGHETLGRHWCPLCRKSRQQDCWVKIGGSTVIRPSVFCVDCGTRLVLETDIV